MQFFPQMDVSSGVHYLGSLALTFDIVSAMAIVVYLAFLFSKSSKSSDSGFSVIQLFSLTPKRSLLGQRVLSR